MDHLHPLNTQFRPPSGKTTPAFVASLLEGADAYFEQDRSLARDYLMRAAALVRAPASPREASGESCRGRLASWKVKRVLSYIEGRLNIEISVSELASLVRLSLSHFSRAFKASVGLPPLEYVTRRRISLACTLMLTTNTPLSQVALDCGLCDQSHLCRVFRRVLGHSPNAWRRANAVDPVRFRRRGSDNRDAAKNHVTPSGDGRSQTPMRSVDVPRRIIQARSLG
jgi:AraC family transcriptional regulator